MKTWLELTEVQPLVSRIMVNSVKKERISHAYLIQGLRGTGKRALAILFSKTLFCQNKNGLEPCHKCDVCKRISSKNHPDIYWIEPDGRSIKNDQIDSLRREFSYDALESTRKIYIISQAETLTVNAANRILKFLEEPTTKTTAILLTENKQAIIPTIRSRCQELDLRPLNKTIFKRELHQLEILDDNAQLLSALTNNIDEALSLNNDKKIYDIQSLVKDFIAVILNNYNERYLFIHQQWLEQLQDREEIELGIDLLILAFKDIIYAQIKTKDLITVFHEKDKILEQAIDHFSQKRLLQILQVLLSAKQKMKQHIHPVLVMEQLVLQI